MLAPMQGLTNRAMRDVFIDWVRPDVVFTEFMRVSNVSRKRLVRNDLIEAGSTAGGVPLVAQLVGNETRLVTLEPDLTDADSYRLVVTLTRKGELEAILKAP